MVSLVSVVVPIGCVAFRGVLACDAAFTVPGGCNVRGEPVFRAGLHYGGEVHRS